MDLNKKTARALRFAARLADRAEKGKDLGDSITVESDWVGGTRVELNVWRAGTHADVPSRLLAIRKELGGTFAKNDPNTGGSFDESYARLERPEEDFTLSIVASRSATCERRVVSVEMIEHPAQEAYTERREIVEWDCSPLNTVAPAVSA